MIGVDRGVEPLELQRARWRRLAEAVLHRRLGTAPPAATGYDVVPVKKRLWEGQNRKCAYCERTQGYENEPVEHFRPKGGAQRDPNNPSSVSPAHYWWLAWTWENLFFACAHCNGTGIKANHFPIAGAALSAMDFDLTTEVGLVDPGIMDPLDHIKWAPVRRSGAREHWMWLPWPVGGSPAGRNTLSVFRWSHNSLADEVTHHLRTVVLPRYDAVAGAPAAGKAQLWSKLRQDLLSGQARHQAAVWWALEEWRHADGGAMVALANPRPGTRRAWAVPAGLPAAPPLVPDEAWWRLLSNTEIDKAYADICCASPRTAAEVRDLTTQANCPGASRVSARLKAMVASGSLALRGSLFGPP